MKIMFIGCGNMGQALIEGFSKSAYAQKTEIYVNDSDTSKAQELNDRLQLNGSIELQAASAMDAIVLAVKPDIVPAVCQSLKDVLGKNQMLISIAAGVDLATLRTYFPGLGLCRVMPNIAALVGEAVSSLSYDGTNQEQEVLANAIFSACGKAFAIPENLIDAVVGLSGSGPAYLMLVAEALTDGAVKMGLPREMALAMAIQTIKGSAILLELQDLHPAKIKDMVCSPGGTSIAAVQVLEDRGLRSALIAAVEASAKRNRELAEQRK